MSPPLLDVLIVLGAFGGFVAAMSAWAWLLDRWLDGPS